jgi:hypothetical protein
VGGTYSAPGSYLGSAPGSVRASSDSATNGAFGPYPPGPGSTGGSWDWSMAERLPRCVTPEAILFYEQPFDLLRVPRVPQSTLNP